MKNLSQTAKDMLKWILVLAIVEIIVGIFALYKGEYVVGHVLGVAIGSLGAMAKLIHLEYSINKSIDKGDKKESQNYFRLQYILRMLLTFGLLGFAAFLHPKVNVISVGIGLINMNIAAYIYKLLQKSDDTSNE